VALLLGAHSAIIYFQKRLGVEFVGHATSRQSEFAILPKAKTPLCYV